MQPLDAPPVFHELRRQPVEQFGVRGPFAGHAEIVDGPDDATSEVVLPDPVHHDSRGERMVRPRQPASESETAARLSRSGISRSCAAFSNELFEREPVSRKRRWNGRGNRLARRQVITSQKQKRRRRLAARPQCMDARLGLATRLGSFDLRFKVLLLCLIGLRFEFRFQ